MEIKSSQNTAVGEPLAGPATEEMDPKEKRIWDALAVVNELILRDRKAVVTMLISLTDDASEHILQIEERLTTRHHNVVSKMPFKSESFDALNLEMTRNIASLVDRDAQKVIESDEKER